MQKRIAVVLNTLYHVETAISVYFTLAKLPEYQPRLVLLHRGRWKLIPFLKALGIRYLTAQKCTASDFDKAIIISAFTGHRDKLPLSDHPMVRDFEGRRILISHNCTVSKLEFKADALICLSPIAQAHGHDFIYQCENPALEKPTPLLSDEPVAFLVQGHLGFRHRNIQMLLNAVSQIPDPRLRVLFVGESAGAIQSSDSRIASYSNLSEAEFYSKCATAHFVLPLIDPTRNQPYMRRKFTSSYGISFASLKPAVVHEAFHDLYPVPSLTYRQPPGFQSAINKCLRMSAARYAEMIGEYRQQKDAFRKHNRNILKKYL